MAGAAVAIALSALIAAWVPARRAARTDPIAALKSE
jgi:ABC-type lipoprotein release transport system permease subunit